jgi:hypothetical protein
MEPVPSFLRKNFVIPEGNPRFVPISKTAPGEKTASGNL